MSLENHVESGRVFVPFGFKSAMQELLDEMSQSLNQPKKHKRITTKLKTNLDLNICRPISSLRPNERISIKTTQTKENWEDLIIVWLDQNINKSESELPLRKTDLRQIIDCLMSFNDVDKCIEYIKSITQEKIFLIISGSLGEIIMDSMNQYSQIISIYIYCKNIHYHENWSKTNKKIVRCFTSEYELIKHITQDVSSFFQNNLPINIINSIDISEKSVQDLTKHQAKFMWSQILMEILLYLPQTPKSKQSFIAECRRRYKNNNFQQNQINEFEKTYSSSNALSWYTRDSFVYRIVNKALRTENIIYIFKCRFFIIDLFKQLTKSYQKFVKLSNEKALTVYRGQMMTAKEFCQLKENVNGFISINTFFSTSTSSDVVFSFAGNGDQRPMFESIFFEIELDLNINTTPFAEMSSNSQFKSEYEILLCMGAIFRIEFVDQLTENIWHIKLVSINQNDILKLNDLKIYLKNDTNETLTSLALGSILQKMGEYDKAQASYETLLIELPINHPDRAAIYNDLAMALFKTQNNLNIVLKYLIQSMMLQMKTFPRYFLMFTQTLSNIAAVYREQRNFKRAISLFQLTLQILNWDRSKNKSKTLALQRSEIYDNIGHIHSEKGQKILAIKYFQMSLNIHKKILPNNHPDIALSLNNIGTMYLEKLNYETANLYFLEAKLIVEQCLPFEQHPDIAQLYNNIGLLEYNQGNLDQSLIYYEKALIIQLKCLSPIHKKTAALYNNIGHVYFEKKDYSMALEMFKKGLSIREQCTLINYREISHAHQNIGKVHRALKDYQNALFHCSEALKIARKYLSTMHFYTAEAYRNLGRIYNDLSHYETAMQHFQKALVIYSKSPPIDKTYLATLHEDIGIGYYNTDQYNHALENLQKSLEIFRICDRNRSENCIKIVEELISQIETDQLRKKYN